MIGDAEQARRDRDRQVESEARKATGIACRLDLRRERVRPSGAPFGCSGRGRRRKRRRDRSPEGAMSRAIIEADHVLEDRSGG